jgi:ubiquinone biosynthesis protein UbiJ
LSASLPDPKATPAVAFCFFANHVLDGAAWARGRLAPFAGRTIELRAPLLPTLRVTITPQGRLEAGGAEVEVAAVVNFGPRTRIHGTSELVPVLEELARTLRWDVEEDLSRVIGDVLAHRAVDTARALRDWQRDAAARVGEALAGYAVDEARLVVRREELAAFGESLARLARALDALEQRIGRLA